MPPSYSDISYFLEVVRTKNISRAAERIGISQPSLSIALTRLETALSTTLLIRTKSGVELTKPGAYFAQHASTLIFEWESLKENVLEQANQFVGRFSVGCHVSVARFSLPPIISQIVERYPRIELQLKHDLSRNITEEIISHNLDFGIVVNPVFHPDLVIHELCSDKVTLWDKHGRYSDVLIYDPSLLQAQAILQKINTKKKCAFTRFITSSSLEVISDLAIAGVGTAILPTRVATLGQSGLKSCGQFAPFINDSICFIYRADSQRTAASKALINIFKKARI